VTGTGPRLLVECGTFATTDAAGDVTGVRGSAPDGLFVRDARHLSRWRLTADGTAPTVLTSRAGSVVLVPPGTRDDPPVWTLFREQAVGEGVFAEELTVLNNTATPVDVGLALEAGADFADQFELRADHRRYPKPGARHGVEDLPAGLRLTYRRGPGWTAATEITADPAPEQVTAADGTARTLHWRLALPAHGTARIVLRVRALAAHGPRPGAPVGPAALRAARARDTEQFVGDGPAPRDTAVLPGLTDAVRQGLTDLAGLRVPVTGVDGEALRVPGAGAPWFLTLFGRDALLTSLFALPYRPALAATTLSALAAAQGTGYDPARLEQPGRIPHELRHGELAHFGQVPYGRYYGSADATPLFLILLQRHATTTGDTRTARRLEEHARAAVQWMFRDGGLTDHGYLVYTSDAAAGGLANQNWKDSAGAVCFADGTPATGAIAVAEVQGYAWDALRRTARLAADVWHDPAWARRLERAAGKLRERFTQDFWLAGPDFPALALDGTGRQADALASDAGHLLWSGILDPDRARRVGTRLLEPDFFSGWGIRTLAAGQTPYHPLSYHRGSVWPHDNALIALGLAAAGLPDQARTVAAALLDAAAHHHWRLPEVLAGYSRDRHPEPVPHPHACSPQAWAAAAPLALLTAVGGTATS